MQYYLSKDLFQASLAKKELSRLEKLLLILFYVEEKPVSAKLIKELARENGFRECVKWNVSDILCKSNGKAILLNNDWSISNLGKQFLVDKKLLSEKKSFIQNDVADLRHHLNSIQKHDTITFLDEAITCLEANQKRAAVVFSWIGAIAILHEHVINFHLVDFNDEALRRDSKWKRAKNTDDLSRIKEFEFLNILEAISVIGKNVKQELQTSLQLRNSCGHPNSLKIGERKVSAHIEVLILNVYSKY